jgi:hypothetical protein
MEQGYRNWVSTVDWRRDIPHYYGDYVRSFFIATAVLSFIATPLWGDLLPFGIIPQVGAAVLLVILAGVTTARNMPIMVLNAVYAAISVILLESYAIKLYHAQSTQLFIAREAGVLLMLAALYFSVKTVRAMLTGKLGHEDTALEFDDEAQPVINVAHPGDTFDPM